MCDLRLVKMFSALDPEQDLDVISSTGTGNDRVQVLRQLLLSQLDLIQKQSEVISSKNQQIKDLQSEIETLKKPLPVKKCKVIKVEPEIITEEDHEEEIMETEEPYFTLQNNEIMGEISVEEKKEVIPGWRIKPIAPSYVMEGTENIEDENFLKRHQKPENDEKRRKRWDVQRIREQRHVARLRARYNEEDECNLTQPFTEIRGGNLATFVPNPDLAEEICVQEKLPVSVFGCVLPSFGKQDFFLPWINPK